jgi:hypothetical protein
LDFALLQLCDDNEVQLLLYIDFLYIKKYSNGVLGVSKDSSVAGGVGIGQASAIIQELTEAINYVRSLGEKNGIRGSVQDTGGS